jgi:hypothetical protein
MSIQSLSANLIDALTLVNQQLLAFTTDTEFNDKLTLTFGNAINPQSYQQLWSSPDFNLESVIEIIPQSELNGANGAFSRDTGKIYLAQEYLEQNFPLFEGGLSSVFSPLSKGGKGRAVSF